MIDPAVRPRTASVIDDTDRALINALQGDFPLTRQPFFDVAARLGLDEAQVIARLQRLLNERVLTRFGPMFQIERIGGAFCLAAMRVPEGEFGRVSAQVNDFPEVAHNYRREHALNMWFVLATERPDGIADCARRIEVATGLPVFLFPKEREYFVEMKLEA
ncbi:Lrp/AsnC family transcriptional regulator [Aromatoleum diolicum]|uniref:siroheme decarboxylase n=1 Tax=Aromatoleum diolicum TaxID=75796 RepID=A0ABX1QHR7_9RHOO|nr:AsnC family transcriptional regulator [Aromatoleum diolicum]NMG76754.1 AsnC family transcriptional regulator [Aromatoleum diolicum]